MADAKRPNIKLPDGYENEEAFLTEMRDLFADDELSDLLNARAGTEDLQFLAGEQWDQAVKAKREGELKPVLTINRLPAFVAQVVGRRKLNETQVKIVPDASGKREVAKVREGLVRSIQKQSRATFAYDNAMIGAVACGIGNFQLALEYENDDVWDQCIRVKPILDHFSVVWDRMMTDPTGADASRCFVLDTMTWGDFNERFPWATPADVAQTRFNGEVSNTAWFTKADVRVVSYWRMRSEKRTLALMLDNTTQDITDKDVESDPELFANIAQRPDGAPFIREVDKPHAEMYLCSGLDVLEGPYRLPLDRVPVFRVPGWELRIGQQVHRWGIVRHMKDPQRLHNYWRSVLAEKIMRSPKATWVASDTSVAGREAEWRASGTSNDPLLIWNAESGQKPERSDPIQVESALIEQIAVTTQDLKDVSNIHEANLGMPSNEVSGKAINARVAVSDTGTAIYQDNIAKAIEECGRVMNDLIPIVYDTPRIVQVIGEDSQEMMQAIGAVADGEHLDITQGKYSVSAITGRSYATKREEAAESMMALAQAIPQVYGVAADLIVSAMDWPDADKIAARLKRAIPPNLLSPAEMSPEEQQAAQQQGEQSQQAATLAAQEQAAKIIKTGADAALSTARANNYTQQANAIPTRTQNETVRTASEATSRELRDHLAVVDTAVPGR